MSIPPFHLAFPVGNLDRARKFYGEVLGCSEGRSSEKWVDFNLLGHQLVAHLSPNMTSHHYNPVDGEQVPIPHFGLVLPWQEWEILSQRLQHLKVKFKIPPCIRFKGEIGEQATMFFLDPFGNALEMKAFKDPAQIFAKSP